MKDVIIVGGGTAGVTAAIYAVRNGYSALLLERGTVGGQIALAGEIENYPAAFKITGYEFAANLEKQARELGVEILYEEATALELAGDVKRVVTASGTHEAKRVILAMGATPRKLGLAGEEMFVGAGISYCAVCDAAFYRKRTVAVIGGGNTALQDAVHLSKFAEKVYLVHRRDEFRADKAEVDRFEKLTNAEKRLSFVPKEIVGEDSVKGLVIESVKDGARETLPVTGIFLAIGYTPNTALVKDSVALSKSGYIVTDAHMRTSVPGVYAAGDIVEKPLRQLVTAESDGAIAASFIE